MKRIILVVGLLLGVAGIARAEAVGKYSYAEKGFKGHLILNNQGRYFTIHIETTDKANGQQCVFDAMESGPRINDEYPAIATSESGAKFKLKFSKGGKTVTIDVENKGDECGMSGWFGGKYVKGGK